MFLCVALLMSLICDWLLADRFVTPPLFFIFSFSPTDNKFATCSDDGTVRIWDFLRCHEERILRGRNRTIRGPSAPPLAVT